MLDDDITDFLYAGTWLDVESSHVRAARYDPGTSTLTVRYDGVSWDYSPVSLEQAEAFARADSHGTWLWDNVRVRGTRNQHRVGARPSGE